MQSERVPPYGLEMRLGSLSPSLKHLKKLAVDPTKTTRHTKRGPKKMLRAHLLRLLTRTTTRATVLVVLSTNEKSSSFKAPGSQSRKGTSPREKCTSSQVALQTQRETETDNFGGVHLSIQTKKTFTVVSANGMIENRSKICFPDVLSCRHDASILPFATS